MLILIKTHSKENSYVSTNSTYTRCGPSAKKQLHLKNMQFKTLQTGLFISLLILATGLFLWLIGDYINPIFWAVVLSILFHPLYIRISRALKGKPSLSALLTILVILIVVFVPLYVLGLLVATEAVQLYQTFSAENGSDSSVLMAQVSTILAGAADIIGMDAAALEERLIGFARDVSAQIGIFALDVGRATAQTIIGTLIALYILFFTLRDGVAIMQRIKHALPLGDRKEEMLFARFVSIVHAMFKGTFIIALIQGAIGGLLFAAVGLPSAALWAFVMALLALIPAVGPALIWAPAGILLLLSGNVWQGVVVLAVGIVVISLIDNFLRPILVGRDTEMPDVLILLSVLGGLTLFGIAGIIIGPVITAFFLSMWQLFEHDYDRELNESG